MSSSMAHSVALSSAKAGTDSHATSSSQRSISSPASGRTFLVPFNGLRKGSSPAREAAALVYKSRVDGSRRVSSRRNAVVVAAATTEETQEIEVPRLNDVPLVNYINQTGRIQPPVEVKTKATVFAIFDKNKKIQYIGFSRDVRNSLRTLMGRRPELCYYFKLFNLSSLDQNLMLKCRQQWVSELGLPPVGNGDPVQKNLWEMAGDAGSISERGKEAAAKSKAKGLLQIMVERGLKEEMEYDPNLLPLGKCDVLVSADQTAEEIRIATEVLAAEAARRRAVSVKSPSGEAIDFEIFFEQKFPTNGGWMYDILVSKDDKETRHRVICGRIYPESVNLPEDRFVEIIIGFLLHTKIPRRTEGLLAGDEFPINYFAVSEVIQQFDDAREWFAGLGELPETYWRFNRIHDYGGGGGQHPQIGPNRTSYDHYEVESLISSTPL